MKISNDENILEKKKSHREKHSGRKVEKKKKKEKSDNNQQNAKAFAFNSAIRAERRFRRKQDLDTKKQHIPVIDRTTLEPPPLLITVVGPPKVGKSTLINNLIKSFTKSPLTNIKGPVTVVTSKKRRITIIECNNDINSMIDLAKISDLCLLLCDASFGFEMEIFEFLNICQVHGMPKIMGVLTHLDLLHNAKTLKRTKKTLKQRFWTEVYDGAKLFYLSGVTHGDYLKNEIKNLARFISVMKTRPITWRNSHSYLLADRLEDLTNPESIRQNKKCLRDVSLYGYVRGIPLNRGSNCHIAGVGDYKIHDINFLPDPCPLPDTIKKRNLIERERFIYAPFSGVGGIVYDKDAVYVDLGGSHSHEATKNEETNNFVKNLIDTRQTLDMKIDESEIQMFTTSEKIKSKDVKDYSNLNEEVIISDDGRKRRKVIFPGKNSSDDSGNESSEDESEDENSNESNNDENSNESDNEENDKSDVESDEESYSENETKVKIKQVIKNEKETENLEEDTNLKWKENLLKKAKNDYFNRLENQKNLMKIVYGIFNKNKNLTKKDSIESEEESGEEIGGLFRALTKKQKQQNLEKEIVNMKEIILPSKLNSDTDSLEEIMESNIKNCFVTGKWKESEDANELLRLDNEGIVEDDEINDSDELGSENESSNKKSDVNKDKESLLEKKLRLKRRFDAEYDNGGEKSFYEDLKLETNKQAELNRKAFENLDDDTCIELEGFRAGMYVRIELKNLPSEFVENFDATYPIVIGGLNIGEENIGYVNVKFKKHRWYNRLLKTKNPVIISIGWRRFQTIPVYSKLEDDLKSRYLKYTPEHIVINATFWGPITPQGTGCLAIQDCTDDIPAEMKQEFRIAATGAVQELDKSSKILKKLKLVGYPLKILKRTAFIKDMFSSSLEVAKFEGARIRTVSGIRGIIKKAVSKPEGTFRATFEDKILMSDIVFCRTWYKVDVPQFYNPITNLLLPINQKNKWSGMKTLGQIKRERNIRVEVNPDHLYLDVNREPKIFKPFTIPKTLQKELPYRDKPKHPSIDKPFKRVAVIKEPHEQEVSALMKRVKTVFEAKQEKLKNDTSVRVQNHLSEKAKLEEKLVKKMKQTKKELCRSKSKATLAEEKKRSK